MTGGRRIVAGYLIPPGTVKGMLRNTHQLYMSVSHALYVICQFHGKLTVIVIACRIFVRSFMLSPGPWMHLINGHGIGMYIRFCTLFEPGGICPFEIADICGTGSGSRSQLCPVAIGICFIKNSSVSRKNAEFVHVADLDARNEHIPDTDVAYFFHKAATVFFAPLVKFADHGHTQRIRCPHGKIKTFVSFFILGRMSAEFFIDLVMIALTKQISIQFPESCFT